MAIGIFLFLGAFWFLGSRTLITYTDLFRWLALFAFAGNLLPYKISGLRLGMERLEWFLFNLLAIGPLLFTLGLSINFILHSKPEYFAVPRQFKLDVQRHWIETGELPEMKRIREEDRARYIGWTRIGIADGAFGYPVITTISPIGPEDLIP